MTIEGPIRWTLLRAQKEFGVSRDVLKGKLDQVGENPGGDGCYGTPQILAAIYTDSKEERARLTREQADKIALENASTRREQVPMAQVEKVWTGWAIGIRDAIRDQELSHEVKENVLASVRDIEPDEYFKEDDPDAGEAD
jgi:hypothetical protein